MYALPRGNAPVPRRHSTSTETAITWCSTPFRRRSGRQCSEPYSRNVRSASSRGRFALWMNERVRSRRRALHSYHAQGSGRGTAMIGDHDRPYPGLRSWKRRRGGEAAVRRRRSSVSAFCWSKYFTDRSCARRRLCAPQARRCTGRSAVAGKRQVLRAPCAPSAPSRSTSSASH